MNAMEPGVGLGSAISPQGRAVQSATQRMDPQQAMVYINQAAQQGLAPLSELLHIKMQLDRLKNSPPPQQGGQMPQTTVAQDLMGEMGQMGQGVASLPVNNVGNEQNYAGGGIVAFAGEGGSFVKGASTFVDDYGDVWETAADGTSRKLSPAEKLKWYRVGPSKLNPNITKEGLKNLATGRGMGLLKGAGIGSLLTEGAQSIGEVATGDYMPIENIRDYYGMDPNSTSFWGDLGARALDKGVNVVSLGMAGASKNKPPAKTSEAATAKPGSEVDISRYFGSGDGGAGAAELSAYDRISGGVGAARPGDGFGALIDEARKNVPENMTLDQAEARIAQREKASGIEDVRKEQQAYLDKSKKDLDKEHAEDIRMLFARFGFEMAANASVGDSVLTSASKAALGSVDRATILKKEERKARDDLEKAQLALKESDANRRMGNYEKADKLFKDNQTLYQQSQKNVLDLRAEQLKNETFIYMKQLDNQAQVQVAKIGAAARQLGGGKLANQFIYAASKAAAAGDKPAWDAIIQKLGELTRATSGGYQAAELKNAMMQQPLGGEGTGAGRFSIVGVRPDEGG